MKAKDTLPNRQSGSSWSRTATVGLALGLAILGVGAPQAVTASTGAVVLTAAGFVQGAPPDANGATSFKGVPYAAPPTGVLRWRPPQAPLAFNGMLQATAYGAACLAAPPANSPAQSEDCLTLNVWTPAPFNGAAKPVMVFLHGGGFEFGSGASPTYDGSVLATKDVVVVTINYRLGVFGFLAHPSLDAEAGGSGAYGLQDQQAALRWVQQNIANFGGDPSNVTLFGESAGAHAVGILMASPLSQGLFSKAILESGSYWDSEHGSLSTHSEALARGQAFFARLGVTQDPAGLQSLRAAPATTVNANAPWDQSTDPGITAFSPSIDGEVLNSSPGDVFARAQGLNIPLMGGWNAAEYYLFQTRELPSSTPQQFNDAAAQLFGDRCFAQFQALYPAADASQALQSAQQLDGDLIIAEQTWEALSVRRPAGSPNVYAYRFSYTSPYSRIASHTAELPFVFGTLTPVRFAPSSPPNAADVAMANIMTSYWTNFAHSGDPNTGNPYGGVVPAWPVYTGVGSQVMRLDGVTPSAGPNPDEARFLFIAQYRRFGRFPEAWRNLGVGHSTTYVRNSCRYDG